MVGEGGGVSRGSRCPSRILQHRGRQWRLGICLQKADGTPLNRWGPEAVVGAQGQASVNPEKRPSAQSHPGSGPIVGPGPRAGGVTSSRVMRNPGPGTVGYVRRRCPGERAGRGPLARAGRGSWAGGVGPLGRRGACAAALAWGLAGRLPAGTSPWPRSQGWGDSLVPGRWITPGGALKDRGAATPPLPVLGTPEQVRGGQGYKAGTWQPGPQEPSTNYVQRELRWWVPAHGIWTVCHVGPSCPPPSVCRCRGRGPEGG